MANDKFSGHSRRKTNKSDRTQRQVGPAQDFDSSIYVWKVGVVKRPSRSFFALKSRSKRQLSAAGESSLPAWARLAHYAPLLSRGIFTEVCAVERKHRKCIDIAVRPVKEGNSFSAGQQLIWLGDLLSIFLQQEQ
jgi:hypothetical protein